MTDEIQQKEPKIQATVVGQSCSKCHRYQTADCHHKQSNELIESGGGRLQALTACFLSRD